METAADHSAAEGSLPLMSEKLSQDEYIFCLRRLHGIVSAWEQSASEQSPPWLHSILAARQRRHLLEDDLNWFKSPRHDPQAPALPRIDTEARLLGAMYVMEGSTLGGQLIARHVTRVLGLSENRGNAFFRGHGEQTGPMWKEFCEVLRTRIPDADGDAVVGSAKAMFQAFSSWMMLSPQALRPLVAQPSARSRTELRVAP